MIADYFPKNILARALSVYMIGVTLGSGFAYMLGGAVVGYVEGMDRIIVPNYRRDGGLAVNFLYRWLTGTFRSSADVQYGSRTSSQGRRTRSH